MYEVICLKCFLTHKQNYNKKLKLKQSCVQIGKKKNFLGQNQIQSSKLFNLIKLFKLHLTFSNDFYKYSQMDVNCGQRIISRIIATD